VTSARPARRVAGLLLAAGFSRRMANANKLLLEIDGEALVRRAARPLCSAGLEPVIVVTGHQAEAVEEALAGLPVTAVRNPDAGAGMGASLACGARALPVDLDAVLVALGDMPDLAPRHIAALLDEFDPEAGAAILRPRFEGRPGHPVLFAAAYFDELATLSGDEGARAVIAAHPEAFRAVAVDDPAVCRDLDRSALD
jgi:molybdenum cofactor cytidylyltransferase